MFTDISGNDFKGRFFLFTDISGNDFKGRFFFLFTDISGNDFRGRLQRASESTLQQICDDGSDTILIKNNAVPP